MSFHANDWLSVLLQLLGTYHAAKTSGASAEDTQNALISAGLAIAAHVITPPAPQTTVSASALNP